jgi:hypothetical protein
MSHLPQIFGITDVIIIAVVLVAIGIGGWVAFRWLHHDYQREKRRIANPDGRKWDLNYRESFHSGSPPS